MSQRAWSAGPTEFLFARFGGAVETDPVTGGVGALDLGVAVVSFVSAARLYRDPDFPGNTSFVSDETGAGVAHYRYSAYGVDLVLGADAADAQRFAGRLELSGGLVLMGARIYDPLVGRFLSQDPVFQALNAYSYTLGNPLDFWDPDGADATAIAIKSVFFVAGGLALASLFVAPGGIPIAGVLITPLHLQIGGRRGIDIERGDNLLFKGLLSLLLGPRGGAPSHCRLQRSLSLASRRRRQPALDRDLCRCTGSLLRRRAASSSGSGAHHRREADRVLISVSVSPPRLRFTERGSFSHSRAQPLAPRHTRGSIRNFVVGANTCRSECSLGGDPGTDFRAGVALTRLTLILQLGFVSARLAGAATGAGAPG